MARGLASGRPRQGSPGHRIALQQGEPPRDRDVRLRTGDDGVRRFGRKRAAAWRPERGRRVVAARPAGSLAACGAFIVSSRGIRKAIRSTTNAPSAGQDLQARERSAARAESSQATPEVVIFGIGKVTPAIGSEVSVSAHAQIWHRAQEGESRPVGGKWRRSVPLHAGCVRQNHSRRLCRLQLRVIRGMLAVDGGANPAAQNSPRWYSPPAAGSGPR